MLVYVRVFCATFCFNLHLDWSDLQNWQEVHATFILIIWKVEVHNCFEVLVNNLLAPGRHNDFKNIMMMMMMVVIMMAMMMMIMRGRRRRIEWQWWWWSMNDDDEDDDDDDQWMMMTMRMRTRISPVLVVKKNIFPQFVGKIELMSALVCVCLFALVCREKWVYVSYRYMLALGSPSLVVI